jgi:hypothetical protein
MILESSCSFGAVLMQSQCRLDAASLCVSELLIMSCCSCCPASIPPTGPFKVTSDHDEKTMKANARI